MISGNVGIGTTTPGSKLVVEAASTGVPLVTLNTTVASETTIRYKTTHPSDWRVGAAILVGGAFEFFDVNDNVDRMVLTDSGNVGIGTTAPTEALVVVGNANITGTLYKGTTAYNNPDVAEKIPSTQLLEEGDLVVADETLNNHVVRTTQPYQSAFGVVSPNASLVIGNWRGGFDGYAVALLGRVAVKISLENGAIKRGDALAASSREGTAMKATKAGKIIGYALEDYDLNKKPIELEGTKTEQFKARRLRDEGVKRLREKAKEIIFEDKNNASGENETKSTNEMTGNVADEITNTNNETIIKNSINEINSSEDLKNVYKKIKNKNPDDDDEILKIIKEKESLDANAQIVESNATPKILIVLNPGWQQKSEALEFEQQAKPSIELLGYQKINGSIILTLG